MDHVTRTHYHFRPKAKRALPLHQATADILHKQDATVVMWPCTSSPQPAQGTSPRHSALVGKCKVSKQSLEVKAFTIYCHNTARHACRRGHLTVLVAQPRCSSSAHQGNPGGFAGQPCCAHGLSQPTLVCTGLLLGGPAVHMASPGQQKALKCLINALRFLAAIFYTK